MNELYITYRKRYVLCTKEGRIITPKMKDGTYSTLTDSILKNHLQQHYAVAVRRFLNQNQGGALC